MTTPIDGIGHIFRDDHDPRDSLRREEPFKKYFTLLSRLDVILSGANKTSIEIVF